MKIVKRYCKKHDFVEILCPKCEAAILKVLDRLEKKISSLEGTIRFMAMASKRNLPSRR